MAGHTYHRIPIATELHGGGIALPVHEIVGAKDGPTVAVLALLHGSEWLEVDVMRRLLAGLEPGKLAGRVLVVPVGNPVAFHYLSRNVPLDESDAPDINRNFPGRARAYWPDMLARAITTNVLEKCDYLIDLHHGIWGTTWYAVCYPSDLPNADVVRKSEIMAHAFGHPIINLQVITQFPGPSSATSYAGGKLNVPSIVVEIGGAGFDQRHEEAWITANVDGMVSVMRALRMLEGEPIRRDRYLHYKRSVRLEPENAGYLVSEIGPDMLGKESPAGTVAGRIISPYTFKELQVLRSSVRGMWWQVSRSYPVHPGGWGYNVIDLDDEHTKWSAGPSSLDLR